MYLALGLEANCPVDVYSASVASLAYVLNPDIPKKEFIALVRLIDAITGYSDVAQKQYVGLYNCCEYFKDIDNSDCVLRLQHPKSVLEIPDAAYTLCYIPAMENACSMLGEDIDYNVSVLLIQAEMD